MDGLIIYWFIQKIYINKNLSSKNCFFSFKKLIEKVSSFLCESALQISSKVLVHALDTVRIYANRVPFTT